MAIMVKKTKRLCPLPDRASLVKTLNGTLSPGNYIPIPMPPQVEMAYFFPPPSFISLSR